ncbi:MAG: HAD-IA family hydrolase [Thermodesulfobacteriota bacterium]|nr:HAD-IA family hydrolase [Thermodesulfobacteriota bacterium]
MTRPTLVFDFDGTVADTITAYGEAWNIAAESMKLKQITPDEISRLRDQKPGDILRYLGLSKLRLPLAAKRMRQELNKNIESLQYFPGMKKALASLKTRYNSLGILTSNSKENVTAFLKNRDLEVFDFIYSGSRIFGKSAVLKFLLKKHKLAAKDVVYICDEVRDIEAARKVKIKVVAVSWGFNSGLILEKERPEALVHEPGELVEALEKVTRSF